jgi:hypothetical protein
MRSHQALYDCKPKAGAAAIPDERVADLPKWLGHDGQVFRRNADPGIGDDQFCPAGKMRYVD